MSDRPLTAEQRAPMVVEKASVALASGAGCGKTTVLTARFLSLIDGPEPMPLDRIVALTFTDKAARELRDRIRQACRDRLASGADPRHWRGVLRDLEAARIGTFHSFCGEVLKRFPVEAGIDPGAAVLDETLAPTLREEALASCARRWLATAHPDFLSLAIEHGLTAVRSWLAALLADRSARELGPWLEETSESLLDRWERFRSGGGLAPLLKRVSRSSGACSGSFARTPAPGPR